MAHSSIMDLSAVSPYYRLVVSHVTRSLTLSRTRCFTHVYPRQLWGILRAEGAEIRHQISFSPLSGVMVIINVEVGAIGWPSAINPASWS